MNPKLSLLFAPALFAAVFGALALAPANEPRAEASPPDGRALTEAMGKARAGDWTTALARARAADAGVGADIILWVRLVDGVAGFDEYADFLARDADWPERDRIRARAEAKIPADLAPEAVVAFFGDEAPLTPSGALRYADALAALARGAEGARAIVAAWTTLSMSPAEQVAIQAAWEPEVAPHDVERLDMLLWRGLTDQAERMLPLVPEDWRALGRARIAVRRDSDGLMALIEAVPESLANDPGLAYERYLYRVKQRRWEEAGAYMLAHSGSAATLGRPEMWMERRAGLARDALQRGDVATAYGLAASGHGTSGADYAESEWLAGFIALTRMDDPERALGHFRTFRGLAGTPISLGRAFYWIGRAEAAAGAPEAAAAAFREGARYQTSFYGQLAAEEAGIGFDADLVAAGAVPDWQDMPAAARPVARAASLFLLAGDDANATRFFRQAAEGRGAADRAALAQMAIDSGRPHIGLRVAKDAAAEGIVLPAQYYPPHRMAGATWAVPTEWAMAIARQESEFNARAGSGAGARGLMQLMPATARSVAEAEGLPYDGARLASDPIYNARLGTGYLARMLGRFGGSYVLATAAYNAGPGRVDRWIAELGDPRDPAVDPVIWIESIPYSETRNYVMRVLEGTQIYRARLGGQGPIRLAADIRGAG
ncbi:lytic transglycosylase domain-containing protein [Amaricoccus solimangrovi]|uniref:Lytic transglycosylase domain-containing protein n=1 Tax=Amaricoccus solimangrovi TaxID=2589815 RepID=A0A501WHP1_9RHOB|nr:lytic transglycosylase domain-containing protein [Amaricoccus solimangrovi]TPE49403.1 lytic transglycosylase domain-containing protein [Amaricoccus solimangrovi]